MKKTAVFLLVLAICLLMPLTAAAASAQKYNLMTGGGKITAYVIEDEVYVRPQELAKVYAGTSMNFDVKTVDGVLVVTLNKDLSDGVERLRSRSSYDDVTVEPVEFGIAGIDAKGSVTGVTIEKQRLIKLKDLGSIVGFSYTRNKETGAVHIEKTSSPLIGLSGETGLLPENYINMAAGVLYGSLASNDELRVLSKSAGIVRLLVSQNSDKNVEISSDSPLAVLAAGRISAKLQESDERDIDPNKPMVALTFDDGPREGNTERILDALDEVGGRATFFMVGTNVEQYPDTVAAVAEQGSQIANHSYSHPQLTTLGTEGALEEINKTNTLISNAAGVVPDTGRPPYGSIDDDIIAASGMEWYNWNIDTLDWKYKDADTVYNNVMSEVTDRDVVLMHDIHETTVEAALRIIPKLNEMGYQLVTINELAEVIGDPQDVSGHIDS